MLNKNGWSLKEMIVLAAIIIIFLLIAAYYISTLFENYPDSYYTNLENKLQEQGLIYFDKYYKDTLTNTEVIIRDEELKKYDLDLNITDNRNEACDFYIIGSKTRGKTQVSPYINCWGYKTDGYVER